MTISLTNATVIVMKTKLKTLAEIIVLMNEYLDSEPAFSRTPSMEVHLRDAYNPDYNREEGGYDELIEIFACERYIRFKLRDPHLMVEHDISFLPWCDSYDYKIWYDGSTKNIDRSTNQAFRTPYIRSEEEFFQMSTVKDLKGVELDTFLEVEKLHNRLYNYFNIVPTAYEGDFS